MYNKQKTITHRRQKRKKNVDNIWLDGMSLCRLCYCLESLYYLQMHNVTTETKKKTEPGKRVKINIMLK